MIHWLSTQDMLGKSDYAARWGTDIQTDVGASQTFSGESQKVCSYCGVQSKGLAKDSRVKLIMYSTPLIITRRQSGAC